MRVVLKASDVAAIIGQNRYKPSEEVRDELWKKYFPESFTGKTKKDRAVEALGASADARAVFAKALEVKTQDATETVQVFQQAVDQINLDSKLSPAQKVEVIEHVRSRVFTSHGTRSEDKTAQTVTEREGARLVKDNAFYNLHVTTIDDVDYVVTGKIDRIEERPDGSRILVEIKNRANRLFGRVVDYEMIQIQVYLRMLGLVHARLVEQHNNQVKSHDVDRDEELWVNVIMPGLKNFCKEFHSVTHILPDAMSSKVAT
jgi:PD-(D/E)XK nuclease superfamily